MEAVVNGEADAAYSSYINASYYINQVFKGQLRIASVMDDEPAVAAFAVALTSRSCKLSSTRH